MEVDAPERSEPADLYRFGIDTIISGVVQYAAPFHVLSAQIVKETSGNARDDSANVCQHYFNQFLSSFFSFSAGFIQIVSDRLADTIRRDTIRPDIRAQTTAFLSNAIRTESFGDIEIGLRNYSSAATTLGIALQSTSTLNHVIGGAFVGGGAELLLTDGHHSTAGTIAGAVVGGMIAENKKRELREAALRTAIESVRSLTSRVGILPVRLMDQYVSYVLGEAADFKKRDEVKFPRKSGQGAENPRKKTDHVHDEQNEPTDLRP